MVFKKGLLTNRGASTQVATSYGSKEVHPDGIVYVITRVITITDHAPPVALFIKHDLTPVDVVWEPVISPFTRQYDGNDKERSFVGVDFFLKTMFNSQFIYFVI